MSDRMKPLAMPAIGTQRNISGIVSIITPTYNRGKVSKERACVFPPPKLPRYRVAYPR
jgi:hypothetical protein